MHKPRPNIPSSAYTMPRLAQTPPRRASALGLFPRPCIPPTASLSLSLSANCISPAPAVSPAYPVQRPA